MRPVLFPQDELFNEDEHLIYIPPAPKLAPPFPNLPFIEGPCGGMLPEWAFEMAYFLVHASQQDASTLQIATKLRTLIRFQLWQKNHHKKQKLTQEAQKEPICRTIQNATSQELDSLLPSFCDIASNDPALSYLKEAIILSRIDHRFYIPKKESIEQPLKETVPHDETLVAEQQQHIQTLLSDFADRYALALSTLYQEGVLQKESSEIQKTLLLAINEQTAPTPAILKYSEELSNIIALINNLKDAYLDASLPETPPGKLSIFTSSAIDRAFPVTDTFFSATAFLLFFIKSAPELYPFEEQLNTLLQQSPGFLALAIDSTNTLETLFLPHENSTPLVCALTEALNAHMASYLLRALSWPFIEKNEKKPIAPLVAINHLFQSLLGQNEVASEIASLAAWCTFLGFSELVEALVENPDQQIGELSPWDKPFLSPTDFFEELCPLDTTPSFCYTTWTNALFSLPSNSSGYSSLSEALSFFPSKKSLLKKIVTTRHIREENHPKEIGAIVEFIDELIKTVFPDKSGLTCMQLYQAATEQAGRIRVKMAISDRIRSIIRK